MLSEDTVVRLVLGAVGLPVAAYAAAKLSARVRRHAYRWIGALCVLLGAAFLALVGAWFLDTGQLVAASRFSPPRLVPADAHWAYRLLVGAFTVLAGVAMLAIGIAMCRVAPPGRPPQEAERR
ncbi:hypothetical protein [Stenotrophomonas sp.]|uniref:hypothetical protein n=1 Tax=Stenotrophomonas sp. TaxID=69392 RepID=UPI002FC7A065